MKLMKYLEKKYGYGADLNMAGVGNMPRTHTFFPDIS